MGTILSPKHTGRRKVDHRQPTGSTQKLPHCGAGVREGGLTGGMIRHSSQHLEGEGLWDTEGGFWRLFYLGFSL